MMMTERLNDPPSLDYAYIEHILDSGKGVTIQYSKPGYSAGQIAAVDDLCKKHGDRIEVRFYGHYSGSFDASYLKLLQNVQWLSIDCLDSMVGVENLFELSELRTLSLGVFKLNDPEILSRIPSQKLRTLWLCETQRSVLDLSHLVRFQNLTRLHLAGHRRGFETLRELSKLSDLSLRSLSKSQPLGVLSGIPSLRKLELTLGGRAKIDEFRHGELEELAIVRVLGFESLGDLSRFPKLKVLRIEDQIRLKSLDLSTASSHLERLLLLNCKGLERIGQVGHLSGLKELRISGTKIEFDTLLATKMPPTLRTFGFYTASLKANDAYRAKLNALGFDEFTPRA
jgi:hypothetical protein